ncbi:hypothetical protein ACFW04_012311 [Cataglyphis niger]
MLPRYVTVQVATCAWRVIDRLRENNLKLQPDKCEFLRKEVIYLEYIISENGISRDPPLTVTTNGNKYLIFQDNLTKFSKAIPIPNQEANTVSKEFITKIVLEHGILEKILTDQGTNFLSEIFKNTNGALERSHRTLVEYLRHCINKDQKDWDEWIPFAMFTYNTTPHIVTRYTPFELVYRHQAELPTSLTRPPKPTYNYYDYAQELKERLRITN